ncbi:hypothetical protein BST81_25950 [Leptolyngbya sp. 'hensonii']|uniref:pyroglutamyl-peptidase I family protein n=1 Tax=Leptolyngbya sp. 'hensonii' TaxID=1922337 RepID=UPI00094F5B27|nr:hypothetical protein [Leptolyngbya sp. 'hensonii']OLP15505.1 hypothetical protein BST81_25950 [Leptolyngbya sp. 'hensonii']
MANKLLLTSFDVWMPHHRSNASDDLLAALLQQELPISEVHCLRRLPVHFQQAPERVIAAIQQVQPDLILCCGMAETRSHLSLESSATVLGKTLCTSVTLESLILDLRLTHISHDAGQYVCNHLYYEILNYLQLADLTRMQCIFVHVPILTPANLEPIVLDFLTLIQRLRQAVTC